jgi:O-antigen/teichoic acid export membrane protein
MLKKNILFNYLGQLYLSAIGICIFPLYLKYIGGEAYGLVGFFVMLQTWMLLFDLGMSPTLSRQVAISNAQGDSKDLKRLLRSLETIFFVIAAVISILMYAFSDMIAKKWLIIKELNINEVAVCIALMGGVVSFRWFTTLYKSSINGYERQVWINVANIIVITLRLPVALFIFIFIHNPLVIYFLYQLIISLCELIIFQRKMYNCLPETSRNIKIPLISGNILKKVFHLLWEQPTRQVFGFC